MNYKKIVFLISFLIIFNFLFNFSAQEVRAMTTAEIQALIAQLQAQIAALQKQLAGNQSQPAAWCYDFNVNLKIGDTGAAVCSLRTALQKEGFETEIEKIEEGSCKFNEEMASAVSGLQQKYADEILKPLGLRYGTGFLGKSTRAKLNKFYGCGVKPVASVPTISTPVCNIFLTCEGGYTSYNTGEKDSQGCPIIKCVSTPTPVIPSVPIAVPVISEQVKCVFYESKSKQECYSSVGSSCAGTDSCVADVKGGKGERITWKSTCGGYAYTIIDGQNEYAEFKCVTSTTPIPITSIPTSNVSPTITEIIGPSTLKMYETGNWTVRASDPEQGILTYSVYWGEDYLTGGTQMAPKSNTYVYTQSFTFSHNYLKAGTYYPTFIVSDNGGNSVKKSISVNIGEVTGIGFVRFELLDSSLCPPCLIGTICAACPPISSMRIYNAKITVYDEKGNYIATKDTSSGQATFENLPYGNYTAIFSASGFETDKLSFWVRPDAGTDYTVNLKKSSAISSVTPSITLLSPNGGESWTIGSTQNLKWNAPSNATMRLDLVDEQKQLVAYNLANVSGNPGSVQWLIPSYIPAGRYLVKAIACIGSTCSEGFINVPTPTACNTSNCYIDYSDNYFSIVSATTSALPDIQITDITPVSVSQNRFTNYTATVKNNSSQDITTPFVVNLGGITTNIASLAAWQTATVNANFGLTILGPNQVCARVDIWNTVAESNESNNDFCKTVDVVTASTPSITVLSPNGGETWTFGNTYGIIWKSSGVKTASVYLWFSDGTTCKLADVPAENGKYSVQFTENQSCTTQNISIKITSGRYQIKIYTEDGKINDSSDNYFNIVSATSTSTAPIITVTYPNGGETWTKDMTYTVKWSVNGLFPQGSKRVILEKSGVSVLQYSGNAENADLFNLTLTSADIVPGKDYKIKVEFVDTNNTVVASDISDNYFSIVSGGTGLKDIENQLASISAAVSQLIEWMKVLTR